LDSAVFMQQVHGAGVAAVTSADRGRGSTNPSDAIGATDALVTFDVDVTLAVLVADCVPLLLALPGRAVAAVHAGRRGVEQGVVATTLSRLDPPEEVSAVIGPAIGGCCYEVSDDVAAQITASVPSAKATTTWGTTSLDLPAAVEAQLRDSGVDRIRRVGGCTRCNAETFFSHRADSGDAAGRFAGLIVRRATRPDGPVGAR
jgi:YfiH family protein